MAQVRRTSGGQQVRPRGEMGYYADRTKAGYRQLRGMGEEYQLRKVGSQFSDT